MQTSNWRGGGRLCSEKCSWKWVENNLIGKIVYICEILIQYYQMTAVDISVCARVWATYAWLCVCAFEWDTWAAVCICIVSVRPYVCVRNKYTYKDTHIEFPLTSSSCHFLVCKAAQGCIFEKWIFRINKCKCKWTLIVYVHIWHLNIFVGITFLDFGLPYVSLK